MSYQKSQRITLSDKKPLFSGGFVNNVQNTDMAAHYSPYLKNCRLDWSSIVIRPWHELFATLTAWTYPRGIWSYLRSTAADDRIVVRHNQWATDKLVTIKSDWTIAAIATAALIASDNNMQFVNVGDKIYCMNWSDNLWVLSGTTYSVVNSGFGTKLFNNLGLNDLKFYGCNTAHTFVVTIDTVAATDKFTWTIDWWGWASGVAITGWYQTLSNGLTIKFTNTTGHTLNAVWTITTAATAAPSFGVVFNSSMWISWVSANPNVVYKSVWDVYGDFSNIGSDTFTFAEPITGLAAGAEALFYFTKNTIAVTNTSDITDTNGILSYTNRKLQVTEWAANHKCIVVCGTEVYYLTSSNTINKLVRWQSVYGFETLDVSNRPYTGINKTMQSLDPDQSKAFGYYEPDTMLIKRHLKSLGSTINDICIVYDTTKDCFLFDTNIYYTDWIWFKWQNYTTSNTEAKVFKNEYGQDDDWSPIPFEYRTKEFFISDPTLKKVLRESRTLLDINELANVSQSIYIDWVVYDTKTITVANIPISSWGIATTTIGTSTIGTWWWTGVDDDYYEVDILRTKWNLNRRFHKVQRRRTENSVAGKCRLKNLSMKAEVLSPETTNLTA